MCLKRPSHTNVCSPACVFASGWVSFKCWGVKISWHCGFTWFGKWNVSIIFFICNHALSIGGGKGRGRLATLRRARLHMLSYARNMSCMPSSLRDPRCTKVSSHCSIIKNTWLGDSDLKDVNHVEFQVERDSDECGVFESLRIILYEWIQ